MAQQRMSEFDIDLAQVREVKRLLTRGLKKLKLIERGIMKRRAELREEWRGKHERRRQRKAAAVNPHDLDHGAPADESLSDRVRRRAKVLVDRHAGIKLSE